MSDPNSGNGPGQSGYGPGQGQPGQGGYGQGGFGPGGDFGQSSQGYGAGGGYGSPPGQFGPGQQGRGQPGQGQYGPPPGQYSAPNPYGGPGQYSDPGGYGSMPSAQMPAPVSPADAPPPVRQAVMLMFVRAGIGVLGFLVTLATLSSLKDSLRSSHPDFDQAQINSDVNAAVGVAAVIGVIFLVLYILLALQVRKGKNWARIVTWVVAGFGILGGLIGLAGTATGLAKSIGLVASLVDIAIVILLVRGGPFFAKRRLN